MPFMPSGPPRLMKMAIPPLRGEAVKERSDDFSRSRVGSKRNDKESVSLFLAADTFKN